jgi:signal transduction histidine kinase
VIKKNELANDQPLVPEWSVSQHLNAFIVHDLKNLVTLQSMTLENAKHLTDNPEFVANALATFTKTTDKMISLIASLSIQGGQFCLSHKPVNILEVIEHTVDDLNMAKRNGIKLTMRFPSRDKPAMIFGNPDSLKKVFTNVLLNAIQSLPNGAGCIDITVGANHPRQVVATIRDTGCGIAAEQLEYIFHPFRSTKAYGMGIGLYHTRSMVQVHGGQMRIDSQLYRGTTVELEFPHMERPIGREQQIEA